MLCLMSKYNNKYKNIRNGGLRKLRQIVNDDGYDGR